MHVISLKNSSNIEQPPADLLPLTDAERHQVLVEWNATRTPYPRDACIHQLFEAQVEQTPEAIAVVFEDQQLTYRELNAHANQLARFLRQYGVGPEVLVGICLERSLDMVVGLLGILKAGGAYVPLDPTYPKERLAFMLEDAQVRVLVTKQPLVAALPAPRIRVVCLDVDWATIAQESAANLGSATTAEHLAYVMYTSGSTGIPKGIAISHRAVVRLVCETNYVQLGPTDRLAQASNAAFDAATFEIWSALVHGARLIGLSHEVVLSPQSLAAQLRAHGVSVLFLTTALFNQLAREGPWALTAVRQLLFGGEAVAPRWVREVLDGGGPERLLHVYGPTESTTFATWHWVKEVPEGARTLPIGRPIANTQVYLLDKTLQPVPIGVPGELYIGGDGLARGYLHRPELTAEKFIPHPFSQEPGARLYKTGDLARYQSDGNIEFVGRLDDQVKIRGFRIEPGEIEAVFKTHPEVHNTAVLARESPSGEKRLIAYVVVKRQPSPTRAVLRTFLQEKLPDYMVPADFVTLDTLPLTPNGKVDRRALPVPGQARPALEAPYAAPRMAVEEMLAGLWEDVLGLEQVGIHDNFFDLGGHSLGATQIVSRVRDALHIELPLSSVFENPTVTGLATNIEKQRRGTPSLPLSPLHPMPRSGDLPLAFSQERVWFVEQLYPTTLAYNFQATINFTGPLETAVLERSLSAIVHRHEIYRTTFRTVDGRPVQVIHAAEPVKLPVVDLQTLPEMEREAAAQQLVSEAIRPAFDLAQLPLVRWTLLRVSEKQHRLLHVEHHLVHDGWSFNVFLRELLELYKAFSMGKPSPHLRALKHLN